MFRVGIKAVGVQRTCLHIVRAADRLAGQNRPAETSYDSTEHDRHSIVRPNSRSRSDGRSNHLCDGLPRAVLVTCLFDLALLELALVTARTRSLQIRTNSDIKTDDEVTRGRLSHHATQPELFSSAIVWPTAVWVSTRCRCENMHKVDTLQYQSCERLNHSHLIPSRSVCGHSQSLARLLLPIHFRTMKCSITHTTALAGLVSSWNTANAFDYGSDKIRGVSLGGWLIIEPYITPSIFSATGDPNVVDEWTYGRKYGCEEASRRLKNHW